MNPMPVSGVSGIESEEEGSRRTLSFSFSLAPEQITVLREWIQNYY